MKTDGPMVKPHISVQIDFDEDYVFQDDEEIGSDVQELICPGGWDVENHRPIAGYCDLTLKNYNHDYSPSNVTSRFYPFELPGPQMRVRMAYPYVDLTGVANGTDPADVTVSHGGDQGFAWESSDPALPWDIQDGHYRRNPGGTSKIIMDFGVTNYKLGFKVHVPTALNAHQQHLCVFRYVDDNNFFYAWAQFSSMFGWFIGLRKVIDGVDTNVGSFENNTHYEEMWYYFTVKGNTLSLFCDPGLGRTTPVSWPEAQLETSPSSLSLGYMGSVDMGDDLKTSTKAGLGGTRFDHTVDEFHWSDFGGWAGIFTGRIDKVEPNIGTRRKYAFVRAYDDYERMRNWRAFSGVQTFPATFEDIAKMILAQAGYTDKSNGATSSATFLARSAVIEDAGTTLLQEDARALSRDTASLLQQLQDDEVGRITINGWGVPVIQSSAVRDSAPYTIWGGLAAWSATAGRGDIHISEPFGWDDGKRNVENQIFYTYFKNSASITDAEIWRLQNLLGDKPELPRPSGVGGIYGAAQQLRYTPFNEFSQAYRTSYGRLGFGALTGVDVQQDVFGAPRIPVPGTDILVYENEDGTGQPWHESMASNVGTVSIDSDETILTDTGQDFSGNHIWSVNGNQHSIASSAFILVTDANGNRAIAHTQEHESDVTKVYLSTHPYSDLTGGTLFVGDGFLFKEEGFDRTATPLTYNIHAIAPWFRPGLDGDGLLLEVLWDAIILDSTIGSTAFITLLRVLANKYTPSLPASARQEDSVSQLRYGRKREEHNALFIDRWSTAEDRAYRRLELRKDAREIQSFNVKAFGSSRALQEVLYRDPGDRVRIIYEAMSSDRDCYLEMRKLTVTGGDMNTLEAEYQAVRIPGSDSGREGRNWFFDGSPSYFGITELYDE